MTDSPDFPSRHSPGTSRVRYSILLLLCTLAMITYVDRAVIGNGARGPITAALQDKFFGLFDGRTADRWGWLDPVAAPATRDLAEVA